MYKGRGADAMLSSKTWPGRLRKTFLKTLTLNRNIGTSVVLPFIFPLRLLIYLQVFLLCILVHAHFHLLFILTSFSVNC